MRKLERSIVVDRDPEAVFALISGLLIYVQLRVRARENALPLSSLMVGGSLYVVFIGYLLWSVLA